MNLTFTCELQLKKDRHNGSTIELKQPPPMTWISFQVSFAFIKGEASLSVN